MANFLLLPALPPIAAHFDVSIPAAQFVVTAFLVAFAAGVLVAGPFADRYGRRPLLLGGMVIGAIGAALALAAPTLSWLIVARAVQGVGAGAGIAVARAALGDLYSGADLSRKIATLTSTMVIGTASAPLLGGLIVDSWSWRASFWFLLGACAIVGLLIGVRLPETRRDFTGDRSFARIWHESRVVIARPAFMSYVLQSALVYGLFLAFISLAPHIMARESADSAAKFGLYYLFLSGGYFLGNLYISTVARGQSEGWLMRFGLGLQFAFAALALALAALGITDPLIIFAAQFVLCIGQGLALPNITARGVALAPGYSGVASSVMGFTQMSLAAIAVQLMGFAPTTSWLPVLTFCAVAAAIAWAAAYLTPSP